MSRPNGPHRPLRLLVLLIAAVSVTCYAQPPWTFVSTQHDHNGFPLNPAWKWQHDAGATVQQTGTPLTSGQLKTLLNQNQWPTQLSSGDKPANLLPFSNSHPKQDTYSGFLLGSLCGCWLYSDEGQLQSGHLNFTEAAFTGILRHTPEHQTAIGHDDDVDNFHLDTRATFVKGFGPNNGGRIPGGAGTTGPSPGQLLQLEFQFAETLAIYTNPTNIGGPFGDYWANLGNFIDSNPAKAKAMIDGHEATAIGVFGLDLVHAPAGPEIHPVHVLTVRENNTNPANPQTDDFWAYFARVSGNEGKCSSYYHSLSQSTIKVSIPPPRAFRNEEGKPLPGVTAKLVAATVWFVERTGENVFLTDPTLFSNSNDTVLTLHMPSNGSGGPLQNSGEYNPDAVFGEIRLEWTPPTKKQPPMKVPPFPMISSSDVSEPEEQAVSSWELMNADQQIVAKRMYASLKPNVRVPLKYEKRAMEQTNTPPAPPPEVAPEVVTSPNKFDEKDNLARFQALCIAAKGNLPKFDGICGQFQPVTTLVPLGANGGPATPNSDGVYPSPLFVLPKVVSHTDQPIAETVLKFSPSGKVVTVPGGDGAGPVQIPDGVTEVNYQSRDKLGNQEAGRKATFKVGPR